MIDWPIWDGDTVACLATGPSVTVEQVEAVRVRGWRALAINHMGLKDFTPSAPWADAWYSADNRFWVQNRHAEGPWPRICGQAETLKGGLADLFFDAKRERPPGAKAGGHSGFQALQIAIKCGAARVVLVGYDCHADGERTNYFGRKPVELEAESSYEYWPRLYRMLDVGAVEVLNATPGSAITAFPFMDLQS